MELIELTDEQRANLTLVREVLIRKIESNEPKEWLDDFVQVCGAHGCVLGDYIIAKAGGSVETTGNQMQFGYRMRDIDLAERTSQLFNSPRARELEFGHELTKHVVKGYGLEFLEFIDVFGTSSDGSLQERLDLVNEVLNYEP